MQITSIMIWTKVVESISYDEKRYVTSISNS